jgi:subfamily B ATP-binding cassette protein MsbA
MVVISAGLSLVFPAVLQQVVDTVLERQDLELLNQITVLLLVVFLIRSVTSLLENYNLKYVGEKIMLDLRRELYIHLQTLSIYFYTSRRTGELLSRLTNDVSMVRSGIVRNINLFLQQALMSIGAVIIMFVLNWQLTLFILGLIPVIVAVGMVFGLWLRRISTQVQDELAGSSVIAEESIQGIREVKSFVRENYETDRYNNAIAATFHASIRLLRVRSVFGPVIAFMAFGALTLVLWFGGRQVIDGNLTGGELVAFLVYGMTVAGGFTSIIEMYSQFQEALGASRRVFELLDTIPDVNDRPGARVVDKVEGRVTFEDVSFSYERDADVLYDIDIDIAPGEIIALVGPSGAGKSTMFSLIPRFYDPTEGRLLLDGIDLRDITQASVRAQIGIVPQEPVLFGNSIRENIRYGRLEATEDEIVAAARAANAHDFITELPQGYDTFVGERGVRLSGGQRQRVAIARAILKDPRILLLDEATSSLDSESEYLVQEALARLMQNRTTIIIAHRLSTIRIAHRIAVLKKGQIVELGTHDDLMAQNGLYNRLYEMQFGDDPLAIVEAAGD